jgi:blue copper oxidase
MRRPWKPVALLAAAMLVLVLVLVSGCGAVDTVGKVTFERPLAIPPLAASHLDDRGRRVFDLRAQEGRSDFGAGREVRTWGFSGDYLGPTLRVARGEQVVVNVTNGLAETTTVHWHGMHLPATMDGGPHQPIAAGGTWSPSWTIDQPAATLWYHPHPHGETADHVRRGLAGMFLLDDPADPAQAALPHRYGIDDVPVIVQDRDLRDGDFGGSDRGSTLLVNGTPGPYLEVTSKLIRLRLLNASTARVYAFGLADERGFALVGTDGGLLAKPHFTTRVQLSPGERAEIVVPVTAGERVALRSFAPDLGDNFFAEQFGGGRDQFDVLELRAAAGLTPSAELPRTLARIERLDPAGAAGMRKFRLNGTSINGQGMDMGRVDATVTRDTTEVWDVSNQDGQVHSFHVHDTQFQVVSVAGRQPPPELAGWKDTVLVPPNEDVRIVLRFTDYADPDAPYMFHCHLLMHEDNGMMGQFMVVAPGQAAGSPAGHIHPN